jgi:hypothetical protein
MEIVGGLIADYAGWRVDHDENGLGWGNQAHWGAYLTRMGVRRAWTAKAEAEAAADAGWSRITRIAEALLQSAEFALVSGRDGILDPDDAAHAARPSRRWTGRK